jgi:hypothetical protein
MPITIGRAPPFYYPLRAFAEQHFNANGLARDALSNNPQMVQASVARLQGMQPGELKQFMQGLDPVYVQPLMSRLNDFAESSRSGVPPSVTARNVTTAQNAPYDREKTLDHLYQGIIGQESRSKKYPNGGDPSLVCKQKPHAIGLGQVIPKHVGPWTKEYWGQKLTPQQFLHNADAQRVVVRGELGKYLDEGMAHYNDPKLATDYAARKWYSGDGFRSSTRLEAGGYPSVDKYALKVDYGAEHAN